MSLTSKYFDVLSYGKKKNNIVLSRRIEDIVFVKKRQEQNELFKGDSYSLDSIEKEGSKTVDSFQYLTKDIFNSLYKSNVKYNPDEELSESVKRFNKNILNNMKVTNEIKTLSETTVGDIDNSMDATNMIMSNILSDIDYYKDTIYGDKDIKSLKKYEQLVDEKSVQLKDMIEKYNASPDKNQSLKQSIKSLEKQLDGLNNLIKKATEQIENNAKVNANKIQSHLKTNIKDALDELEANVTLSKSFALNSSDNGLSIEENKRIIKELKENSNILKIAKMLGNLKPLFKEHTKSKYSKGRGEKIGIETGDDINRIIESEFAMLANKETSYLFYRNLLEKNLLMHKEAKRQVKSKGDCIILADESGSTLGFSDNAPYYYTKGVSISICEHLARDGRTTLYVPFSDDIGEVVKINKSTFNTENMIKLSNNFLNGGTDFNRALEQAISLLESSNLKKPDILFITDGESRVSDNILKSFRTAKKKYNINCIGVLLDYENSVKDVEVKKFCDRVIKVSDLGLNEVSRIICNEVL